MTRFGSDPFVERVREASDLLALVQGQVDLKRVGQRWRGLCPFHQEKTPSFYVSPSHQSYHCFGCGEGGDAFSFVMAQERMSFPEALEFLADRAGIPKPVRRGQDGDSLERIRQALKVAATFFSGQLAASVGDRAREYLERRGIEPASVSRYGVGLAPDGWSALLTHARALVGERTLVEAGLAVEAEGGRIYDRFRNRIMVPIESAGGAPVGFGGRTLGDDPAKYLNSPETAVYRKSSVLFGVRQAREFAKESEFLVVVEGYFDVIALTQAGAAAAVGTCGTALTPEQASLLHRISDRVVLLFDGDVAGRKAALRALPILAATLPEVRVAAPPPGEDPDTWVRSAGAAHVRAELGKAPTSLAFLERQVSEGALNRREALEHAYGILRAVPDPLHRELVLAEAAERLGVPRDAFRDRLRADTAATAPRRPAATATAPDVPASGGGGGSGSEPAAARQKWSRFEGECLRSALLHPSGATALARAMERAGAPGRTVELLDWIANRADGADGDPSASARLLSALVHEHPHGGALTELFVTEAAAPALPWELLDRLETREIQKRRVAVTAEIRRAEERGDHEALGRWLMEKQRLGERSEELARISASGVQGAARPSGPEGAK